MADCLPFGQTDSITNNQTFPITLIFKITRLGSGKQLVALKDTSTFLPDAGNV